MQYVSAKPFENIGTGLCLIAGQRNLWGTSKNGPIMVLSEISTS